MLTRPGDRYLDTVRALQAHATRYADAMANGGAQTLAIARVLAARTADPSRPAARQEPRR